MRASSLTSWIIARVVAGSLALAGSAAIAFATEPAADVDASCRIPFEVLKDPKTGESFPLSAAINENAELPENLRHRYVVADLNSADENGFCRGIKEHFSTVGELSEFPRLRAIAAARNVDVATLATAPVETLLEADQNAGDRAGLAVEIEDLKNYLQQVHRFKTEPLVKRGVFQGYCVGQTLSLCEIVDGKPKLVYRFVTSSSKWPPQLYRYYAPINYIKARNWGSDRRYTPADARRDVRMGGGFARTVPFANDGDPIEMPNFLHYLPMPGYTGQEANGIHQMAGGTDSGGTFGAPVSLGCLRLGRFQAKLTRWWTPTQARFFVHFEPNRYRKFGIAATGKARGFKPPPPVKPEGAVVAEKPPTPAPPSRPRRSSNRTETSFGVFSVFSN